MMGYLKLVSKVIKGNKIIRPSKTVKFVLRNKAGGGALTLFLIETRGGDVPLSPLKPGYGKLALNKILQSGIQLIIIMLFIHQVSASNLGIFKLFVFMGYERKGKGRGGLRRWW